MQVGGMSLLVSILLFYGISLVTSNRHPDATLGFLYGGPGARTDGPLAATAPANTAPTATTERPDHV